MYSLSDLSLTVKNKVLLDSVSLDFEQGKISTILGANGAGKSTLLRCLLGEFAQVKGKVSFNNKSISNWKNQDLSYQRAYIAQSFRPAFALPVFEYLLLCREMHYESTREAKFHLAWVSEFVGIDSLLEASITELSGGEFQLIEFARAWLQLKTKSSMSNKCLLLDEPCSALDIRQTQKIYGLIKEFKDLNGSVILIDHDINLAAQIADNLVMLKEGKILVAGPSSKVFTANNVNDCFETKGRIHGSSSSSAAVYVLESSNITANKTLQIGE